MGSSQPRTNTTPQEARTLFRPASHQLHALSCSWQSKLRRERTPSPGYWLTAAGPWYWVESSHSIPRLTPSPTRPIVSLHTASHTRTEDCPGEHRSSDADRWCDSPHPYRLRPLRRHSGKSSRRPLRRHNDCTSSCLDPRASDRRSSVPTSLSPHGPPCSPMKDTAYSTTGGKPYRRDRYRRVRQAGKAFPESPFPASSNCREFSQPACRPRPFATNRERAPCAKPAHNRFVYLDYYSSHLSYCSAEKARDCYRLPPPFHPDARRLQ